MPRATESNGSLLRRRSFWLAAAFYALWTLVATYPLALAPANHIENWGDPLLNVWIMAWDLHQLGHDPLQLFNANIFYPAHNTLALSELLLTQALQALPIVALTGNFILGYNLIVLLSFFLCGIGAYLLAREALPAPPSLVAGAVYAYSFYRVGEYSHIQILSAQWIPFAVLALLHLWRKPGLAGALVFAAAVTLEVLSSFYLGLFLVATLAVIAGFLVTTDRRQLSRSFLIYLSAAALLTFVVVLPFSLPYFQVERQFGLNRTLADAIGGAAVLRNYLAVPPTSWLYGGHHLPILQHMVTDETLFPGFVVLGLTLIGLIFGWQRRWSAFFLTLTVAGLILSLGPRLRLRPDGWPNLPLPYTLLYQYVPGFHSIRVVGRLGVITTLGLAGLAGIGASTIINKVQSAWKPAIALTLAVLVGVETLAIPTRMTPVETPSNVPPVYHWLARQPNDWPVLELPTISARWLDKPAELERQGHEQYLSIYHWHPTPSGYSGFEPPLFWSVIREAKNFPTDESISFFQSIGIRYIIVHESELPRGVWSGMAKRLADHADILTPVAHFGTDILFVLAAPAAGNAPVKARIVLPSAAPVGSPYRGFIDWANGGRAVAISQPQSIRVEAIWRGPSTMTASTVLAEPNRFASGDTTAPFDLKMPGQPGHYDLTVTTLGITRHAAIDLEAAPAGPIPNNTQTALQLRSAQITTPTIRPGGVIMVTANWRLRHTTVDNYLLRLELTNLQGQVVAASTADPFNGDLETAHWLAGETVSVGQSAILPRSVAPGTYQLRLLVRFADDATWKMADANNQSVEWVTVGTVEVRR